jgi:hypothetical protein
MPIEGVTVNLIGAGQRLNDYVGDRGEILDVGNTRKQHNEFITTVTRNGIGCAHGVRKPGGGLDEDLVANMMAEGVINVLETVQIDEQQRYSPVISLAAGAAPGLAHGKIESRCEQQTIRQAGEKIVFG